MNYSQPWLDTLKYYKDNWEKEVYPHNYKRSAAHSYYRFKQKVKHVPIFGPMAVKLYQKTKEDLKMHFVNKSWYR